MGKNGSPATKAGQTRGAPSEDGPSAGACTSCRGRAPTREGSLSTVVEREQGKWGGEGGTGRTVDQTRKRKGRLSKRQRKKRLNGTKIAFLNMQGARTSRKWEEQYETIDKEGIAVMGVGETHLRDEECPPRNEDMVWEGRNRASAERKGGGVGVLVRANGNWERTRTQCKEHIWMTGSIQGKQVAIGMVYMWTGREATPMNMELYECLREDIKILSKTYECIILGDWNAHLEELDGHTDTNGRSLETLARDNHFLIVNSLPKCRGRTTWSARRQISNIDYCLMTPGMYEDLKHMEIDVEGQRSIGSDHNMIMITFGGHERKEKQTWNYTKRLSDPEVEALVEKLEQIPIEDEDSYSELIGAVKRELEKPPRRGRTRHRRYTRKRWWDKEADEAVRARKLKGKHYRLMVKQGSPQDEKRAWEEYQKQKTHTSIILQRKIMEVDKAFMNELKANGKNAPRKYWRHIKKIDQPTRIRQRLKEENTQELLEGKDCLPVIENYIRRTFQKERADEFDTNTSTEEAARGQPDRLEGSQLLEREGITGTVTRGELMRALKRSSGQTAAGLDEVPMTVLKKLGERRREHLRQSFNEIMRTKTIPEEWKIGKIKLIYKGSGEKKTLKNYRPINVTPVGYRVFMKIIKRRMQQWAENNHALGELQNGFREGRRIEDNIFVLGQSIEIAILEKRALFAGFLDISKAYDSVEHERLWKKLAELGLEQEAIELLREIYRESRVIIEWDQNTSKEVEIGRGLRQGCPLSPLLFMLYISGMEQGLQQSNKGFNLTYTKMGQQIKQCVPGLLYADDVLLLADAPQDLQDLLDTCGKAGLELGLQFNPEKCSVMGWGTIDVYTGSKFTIQGKEIHWVEKYKYLGIQIQKGPNYLGLYEEQLRKRALRGKWILGRNTLWAFNRFEVMRGLWKMVVVPGITFGNGVTCLSSTTRNFIETRQREAGEAVQGDLGWSGFEARETVAKTGYERRLARMDHARWAHKVWEYMIYKDRNTKWRKSRTRTLLYRHHIPTQTVGEPGKEREENTGPDDKTLRTLVHEEEQQRWRDVMSRKPSLRAYSSHKDTIKKEEFYDNTKGSGLLFQARAGTLGTKTWRARFTEELETLCTICGTDTETIDHIVIVCRGLTPQPVTDSVPEALGFTVAVGTEEGRDRRVAKRAEALEGTKRRLEDWWRKNRENSEIRLERSSISAHPIQREEPPQSNPIQSNLSNKKML